MDEDTQRILRNRLSGGDLPFAAVEMVLNCITKLTPERQVQFAYDLLDYAKPLAEAE